MLRTHDRFGHRIDEVEFHPAWHELMDVAVSDGLHATPWRGRRSARSRRRGAVLPGAQVEAGHGCPISMTYAVVPALRHEPDPGGAYEPLLTAPSYDPGLRTPLTKRGLLAGMGMTEKQGGSDVRANTTRAVPAADGTTCSPGTSGSPPRRCATCSWCWPRRPAGCRASWCPACCPTAPATRSRCSG